MKCSKLLLLSALLFSCGLKRKSARPDASPEAEHSFYSLTAEAMSGEPIAFGRYRGKKVLLVNTASECGFTGQYEGLQRLHEEFGEKLVVLGFPANDFGKQEPGQNPEIASFCQKNYGVTFQMFKKVSVRGEGMHPVFAWLSDKERNGWNAKGPAWNFTKFLVNEKGQLVRVFGSGIKPMSKEVINAINEKI